MKSKNLIPIILLSLWGIFCIIGILGNMDHYGVKEWVVIIPIALLPYVIFFVIKRKKATKAKIENSNYNTTETAKLQEQEKMTQTLLEEKTMLGKKKQLPNAPTAQNAISQVPSAPVFIVTQCVSPAMGRNFIECDENNKLWRLPAYPKFIFKYSDLLDYEIVQNGNMITKGGLGRAVVGGALFGGVGAIVGGVTGKKKGREKVTEYKIKIITSVSACPLMYINLVAAPVYSDSLTFSSCTQISDKITALLSRIINENKTAVPSSQQSAPSAADEIIKYKQLLDAGTITQEEFETKKKQLLNL